MIFKLFRKIIFGTIKKIIVFIIVVILAIWFLFFRGDQNTLLQKIGDIFNSKIEVKVNTADGDFVLTADMKKKIDGWLKANQLNEYGDPMGTVYTGGTPLFDEQTGQAVDRYEYLLEKYPELKQFGEN